MAGPKQTNTWGRLQPNSLHSTPHLALASQAREGGKPTPSYSQGPEPPCHSSSAKPSSECTLTFGKLRGCGYATKLAGMEGSVPQQHLLGLKGKPLRRLSACTPSPPFPPYTHSDETDEADAELCSTSSWGALGHVR